MNFVNNFSTLSQELVDELGDALKPVAVDDKKRAELDELTHMLKGTSNNDEFFVGSIAGAARW